MSSFFSNLNDKMRKASQDIGPKAAQFQKQMNNKWAEVYGVNDAGQLYIEDEELADSVKSLEAVRSAFKDMVAAVSLHYKALRHEAEAEKKLGEKLLQVAAFEKFYTADTITAHVAVGKAEIAASIVMEKFAADMNAPLQQISRRYEETYMKQITPLQKRYQTQKTDYLKYKNQVEREDDETKRSNLLALADAAKPVWMDTSIQLRKVCEKLATEIANSLTEWTKKMVTVQRDALVNLSESFKDAAEKALKH
mmetsp:Transcript_10171/g.14708  ORF Transcript_10171/g.14708 Transcript_10171/m.14708 type:complete len:252 (-) Transcript_10171:331-1086(-)